MIAPTPSLRRIYHFPNPFLKLLDLQERVPKTSAGNHRCQNLKGNNVKLTT
jgi:hypothetical protein